MHHFIELSAANHELPCSQRNKKNSVESNTVVATADSNKE